MGTYRLVPHATTPPKGIYAVDVRWFDTGKGTLILRYQVTGMNALRIPPFAGKGRGEDLWETTCFELFLKDEEGNYLEFNFSPSERWAGYFFAGYRSGRIDVEPAAPPEVTSSPGDHLYILTAAIETVIVEGAVSAGLSAVIDETDGTRSYWALAHPSGKPDFHDAACFALPLPAAR